MRSPQIPQLVAVEPAMHGWPSRRKPFDSATAASCEEAALRAEWTLMLRVIALGLQAGSGGDVGSNGAADVVADPADADAASDGAADVAPPAHG
jgi:hypothetical protein